MILYPKWKLIKGFSEVSEFIMLFISISGFHVLVYALSKIGVYSLLLLTCSRSVVDLELHCYVFLKVQEL